MCLDCLTCGVNQVEQGETSGLIPTPHIDEFLALDHPSSNFVSLEKGDKLPCILDVENQIHKIKKRTGGLDSGNIIEGERTRIERQCT